MKLPAGKYWIGDPCYVLDEHGLNFEWDEFCDFIFNGDPSGRANEGVVEHQGLKFAFHGTEYGDGCYLDRDGNEYGVDAGMIACIPYDALKMHIEDKVLKSLGAIHDFDQDFESEYYHGKIIFGHVVIDTDADIVYDDEDEEDEW